MVSELLSSLSTGNTNVLETGFVALLRCKGGEVRETWSLTLREERKLRVFENRTWC